MCITLIEHGVFMTAFEKVWHASVTQRHCLSCYTIWPADSVRVLCNLLHYCSCCTFTDGFEALDKLETTSQHDLVCVLTSDFNVSQNSRENFDIFYYQFWDAVEKIFNLLIKKCHVLTFEKSLPFDFFILCF